MILGQAELNHGRKSGMTYDVQLTETFQKSIKALKAYWESHGKWEKRNCSKKQWIQVQEIKRILGI